MVLVSYHELCLRQLEHLQEIGFYRTSYTAQKSIGTNAWGNMRNIPDTTMTATLISSLCSEQPDNWMDYQVLSSY